MKGNFFLNCIRRDNYRATFQTPKTSSGFLYHRHSCLFCNNNSFLAYNLPKLSRLFARLNRQVLASWVPEGVVVLLGRG